MHSTTRPGNTTSSTSFAPMGQPGHGGRPMHAAGYGHVAAPGSSTSGYSRPPLRHAPPATGPTRSAQDEEAAFYAAQERARMWAGIRSEVGHRLVGMNLRHAMHGWSARRDRPIAAWAVAFLYAYPSGTVYDGVRLFSVAAAVRMVDHDLDLPGPAHLLHRLRTIGDQRHRDQYGWFDPLSLCTYRDPVATTASYVGVGVSCLGTAAQPWEQLRRGSTDDIPGHCFALLNDGVALLLTRAPRSDLGRVVMHGTGDLSFQHDVTTRRWVTHLDVRSMPESDLDVWDQLHDLHVMSGHQQPVPTLEPEPAGGNAS
jgi:hypothetical protein